MVDTASFDGGPDVRLAGVTRDRDARERAFADAERHTRLVRRLRRAIPIVIVVSVGLAFFGRLLNPLRTIIPEASVASVSLQNNKLTMEQPKLAGFKRDNKAYEIVAEAASQDIKKPNIVELIAPVARIEMQKGSWVRLSAANGVYDTSTEKLVVNEKVTVKTDSGLDMRLKQADVEFKTGNMVSNQPVEVDMPDGWVRSEKMRVTDNGKTIIFEGSVRSEIRAEQPGASEENQETAAQ